MYSREMRCDFSACQSKRISKQKNPIKRCGRHSRVFFSIFLFFRWSGTVSVLILWIVNASAANTECTRTKTRRHRTLMRLTIPIKIRTKQIHVVPFFNIDWNEKKIRWKKIIYHFQFSHSMQWIPRESYSLHTIRRYLPINERRKWK